VRDRRFRTLDRVWALLFLLALSACQVRVTAGLDVDPEGEGTVRAAVGLDAEALQAVGDLAAALRVDDLRAAGWAVEGPRPEGDGLTWVRASRPFSDVEEAGLALSQISGPDGPFRNLTFDRERSFLRTRTRVSGAIDLSEGLAGFADADLRNLVGDTIRLDPDGLRGELGADLDRTVQVQFEARLPGSVRSNAPERSGDRSVWRPLMGQQLTIEATSSGFKVPVVPIAAAVVLLLAVTIGAVVVVRRSGDANPR
jgi:hypothetical protein